MIKIVEKEDIYYCEICGEEFPEGNAEWYGYRCPRCGEELILDGRGEIVSVSEDENG